MCFGDDARPPLPPVRGGAVDGDDQNNTPVADVEAFAAEVRAAGTDAELHVYPDAVHSFFDRRFERYEGECVDAWRRMLDFMERHA